MWSLWEAFHFCQRRDELYLGHWVLISLCCGNQGWERGGYGGKQSLPRLPRVPRCSWAPAQMQLEDEAAAKKSRAPCCSLRGRASSVHVCVLACVLCVRKRESDREHENVNEKPCLCREQGTGENVQRAPIMLHCLAPSRFEMLPGGSHVPRGSRAAIPDPLPSHTCSFVSCAEYAS